MAAERAPEPTMDEILASIKRIIADEDRGVREADTRRASETSQDHFSSAGDPYFSRFGSDTGSNTDINSGHGQGDEQLIADIARALNNPGETSERGEEDILDLTRIMTEETGLAPAEKPASAFDDDAFDLGSPLREDAPNSEKAPEAATVDAAFEEDDVFSLDTPSSESSFSLDTPSPESSFSLDTPAAESGASEISAAEAVDLSAEKITDAFLSLEEPEEERQEGALAEGALGDDPWILKSAVEEDAAVQDFTRKEPVFAEAFPAVSAQEEEVLFEAEDDPKSAEPDFAKGEASDGFDEPAEPDFAKAEGSDGFDQPQPETEDSVIAFPAQTPEANAASLAEAEALEEAKPAGVPDVIAMPPVAGASAFIGASDAAVSGQKSLEDSVREMLRPMLRNWLDDNMPRILESALREEVKSGRLIND